MYMYFEQGRLTQKVTKPEEFCLEIPDPSDPHDNFP